MTQIAYLAAMADRMDRDPVSQDQGRATVPMGLGFKWRRFHKGEDTVWVDSPDGRSHELTRTQADVLVLCLERADHGTVTMRGLAAEIGKNPSTVSRAMVKLMSFGLIAYLTGRGRYAGTLILRRVQGDGLDRFMAAAKAKVRAMSQAVQRRISRLQVNVAPYILEKERGVDSLYYYLLTLDTNKGATLTAQLPWTAEDVAEIV